MSNAPFNDAVDGAAVFLPFLLQKFQLSAPGVGKMVVFARSIVEGFGIGGEVTVGFEFFQNGIEGGFFDRGNEFDGLADLVAVGILLANNRQNETLDEQ